MDQSIANPKSILTTSMLDQKKLGKLCFANNRVIVAHIDQSKWTFFGRLHFGHYGAQPHQISKRVRNWPRLPSAHPNLDGGSPAQKKL